MRNRDINPALRIRDFYSFGLQVLNEINFARMHPDEFVQKLEELNSTISKGDNSLYIEGVPFLYTDLKSSLEEAISFLSNQKSCVYLREKPPRLNQTYCYHHKGRESNYRPTPLSHRKHLLGTI